MYGRDFSGPQVVKKSEVIPLLSHPDVPPVIMIMVPSAHISEKKIAFIVYCFDKPFKIGITAKPNASTQRMTPSEKSFHFPPPSFGKKYPDKQEPTNTPIDLYENSSETLSSLK